MGWGIPPTLTGAIQQSSGPAQVWSDAGTQFLEWLVTAKAMNEWGQEQRIVYSQENHIIQMQAYTYTGLWVYAQSHPTLCSPMDCSPPDSSVHRNFPGKNTRVGCHFLLQGIISTQESNLHLLCLLHWQADSLSLSHLGSPHIHIYY